jgi:hypothetical protein
MSSVKLTFYYSQPTADIDNIVCISISLIKINPISNLSCHAKGSHQHSQYIQLYRHEKCPYQHPLTHPTNTSHYVFIQAIHISKPHHLLIYIPHQNAKNIH